MKLINLIFLIVIIPSLSTGQNIYKKVTKNHTNYIILIRFNPEKIDYNYKDCHLIVKPSKWNRKLPVTTVLANNSNDTLGYERGSTCGRGYYSVDNKSLEVEGAHDACDNNIPFTEVILPHKSKTIGINLSLKTGANNFHGKFRVMLCLLLERNNQADGKGIIEGVTNEKIIKQYYQDKKNRSHSIFSNTVEI
jgi:hypothetical protein